MTRVIPVQNSLPWSLRWGSGCWLAAASQDIAVGGARQPGMPRDPGWRCENVAAGRFGASTALGAPLAGDPEHATRLGPGTNWEPPALMMALRGSVLLTCARLHVLKYGSALVAGMWMLSWGSSGRRFKSGRPDGFSNSCTPNWERNCHDRSHLNAAR